MDYLMKLISILDDNAIIEIQNRKLTITSTIKISKYEKILDQLSLSFVIYNSDIEIYEVLLNSKLHIVYNIKTRSVSEIYDLTFRRHNLGYGLIMIGYIKPIYPEYFRSRIPFIDEPLVKFIYNNNIIEKCTEVVIDYHKYLRRRDPISIDLTCCYLIGTFNNEFILIKSRNEIYLVDQHGLHERILYERRRNVVESENEKKMKACRNAIKFGDPLEETFVYYLFNELKKCRYPFICAHGRPIVCKLFP
jgi:hypothetical protein